MAFSPLLAGPHLAFRQIFAFACFLTLLYSGAAHEVDHLHDPPLLMYIPHIWPGGGQCGNSTQEGIFYDGNDIAWKRDVADAKQCAKLCKEEKQCHGWSHFLPKKMCYLKTTLAGNLIEFPGAESGPKPCADDDADGGESGDSDADMEKEKDAGCIIEENFDYRANNIGAMMARVEDQKACAKRSFSRDGALFWTYQPSTKRCWSKTSKAGRMAMEGVVSGSNECGKEGCIIDKNTDYRANNIGAMAKVENQKACAKRSSSTDGALYWTYQPSTKGCWLKTSKAKKMAMEGVVSGNNECGKEEEVSASAKKQPKTKKPPPGLGFALTSAIDEMKGKKEEEKEEVSTVRKDIAHGCLMKENRQIYGDRLPKYKGGIYKATAEECAAECAGAIDKFYNLRCDTFYFWETSNPAKKNCILHSKGGINKGYACAKCVAGWYPYKGKQSAKMKGTDPADLTDVYTWVDNEDDCATLCNLSSCSSYKHDEYYTDLPGNCQLLY